VFQRQLAANLEHISDTKPTLPSTRPDASKSTATSVQVSPPHQMSRLTEEESTVSNSVATDSPPLPPKSSKLPSSAVLDGNKSDSPPEIPRRLSIPNSRVPEASLLTSNVGRYSVLAAPQGLSVAGQQLQNQAEVGDDVAPPLLPRKPIPPTKPRGRVKPKPPRDPSIPYCSEASEMALPPQTEVSPAVGRLGVESITERIPPDAVKPTTVSDSDGSESVYKRIPPSGSEVNSAAAPRASSDPGHNGSVVDQIPRPVQLKSTVKVRSVSDGATNEDSEEVMTPWRPVSEITRDINARAAAASVASETDMKPSVPARRLVIPAAFENPTAQ